MINQERIQLLDAEANRLKKEYNTKEVKELERIAKKEYRVVVVAETPLSYESIIDASGCEGCGVTNGLYLLYYHHFRIPLMLGHDIGHLAAGHIDVIKRKDFSCHSDLEEEASYFSALLNNVSLREIEAYQYLNFLGSLVFPRLVNKKLEANRLTSLGVPHDLIEEMINTSHIHRKRLYRKIKDIKNLFH